MNNAVALGLEIAMLLQTGIAVARELDQFRQILERARAENRDVSDAELEAFRNSRRAAVEAWNSRGP